MSPSIDYLRMFRSLPAPYMMLDTQMCFLDMNDSYLAVTQRSREDLIGRFVFEAFPESGERLQIMRACFERALRGEANQLERQPFSIARPEKEGGGFREVWWRCHHQPLYDSSGNVCGMLQKAEDVTAEVRAEHMRDVISHEFDHRVKNLLGNVSSIARLSARHARDIDSFVNEFEARLQAMTRTHQLLVQGGWQELDLADLINSELQPYLGSKARPIEIDGPRVRLSSHQAATLGMTLHELSTNAAKYGAFSEDGQGFAAKWSVKPGDDSCEIVWREKVGHHVQPPSARGFGSTIIEQLTPMQIGGSVERVFMHEGLMCTIRFPLKKGVPEKVPHAVAVSGGAFAGNGHGVRVTSKNN